MIGDCITAFIILIDHQLPNFLSVPIIRIKKPGICVYRVPIIFRIKCPVINVGAFFIIPEVVIICPGNYKISIIVEHHIIGLQTVTSIKCYFKVINNRCSIFCHYLTGKEIRGILVRFPNDHNISIVIHGHLWASIVCYHPITYRDFISIYRSIRVIYLSTNCGCTIWVILPNHNKFAKRVGSNA